MSLPAGIVKWAAAAAVMLSLISVYGVVLDSAVAHLKNPALTV